MENNGNTLDKLKRWRRVAGITQVKMAETIGCTRQTYSQKENGIVEFRRNEMVALKEVINSELQKQDFPTMTMDELFAPIK